MAWYAGIITLVGTLVIFGITKWLIGSTSEPDTAEAVTPKIYGMRKVYFISLSLVVVIALFGSLRGLPYYPPNGDSPEYIVSVTGRMWNWEITGITHADKSPATTVEVGKLVEFVVSTEDVNHGIGIYDEAGQILTQTQAMPGYPASIYYAFTQPGTYHIVCMEYCGANHSSMVSTLTVQ